MLSDRVRVQIQELAHQASPNEVCGLVSGEELIFGDNLADSSHERFLIDPQLWLKAGVPDCIFHSHTDGRSWSVADIRSCKQVGVPFYLFELPTGREYYYDPKVILPYQGREWLNWVSDCYTLVRDWYGTELHLLLPDLERELIDVNGKYTWLDPAWNLLKDELTKYGFVDVGADATLQLGDIILMNYQSPHPNHLAVYAKPEENQILDHLLHRLSGYRSYGYGERKITDSIWRL